MRFEAVILFFLGIILIWLGLNGKLGVFLASFFTPSRVVISDKEDMEEEEMEQEQSFTSGSGNQLSGIGNTNGLIGNSMGNINY
jgi:hypothetical protein